MDKILVKPRNSPTAFFYDWPADQPPMKRMDRLHKELAMAKKTRNADIYLQRGKVARWIGRTVSLTQKPLFK